MALLLNVRNPGHDGEQDNTEDEETAFNHNDTSNQAELSHIAVSSLIRSAEHQRIHHICTGCGDGYYSRDVLRALCGHDYCRNCVQQLFMLCLTDANLYPPRCCQQAIPWEHARVFLPEPLYESFLARALELETPNPLYCHVAACSRFIAPSFILGTVGYCVGCNARTCARCRAEQHDGQECMQDPATRQLLDLAVANGWRRCNSCGSVVELNYGCYHITCRCRHQFCYLCGATWKTCLCVHHDGDQLLFQAQAVGEHDLAEEMIADWLRVREGILRNHACMRHTWRQLDGRHQCQECYDHMPTYIMECQLCRMLVCRRCSHNYF
ncbi:hypothetical protein BD289DRAFT_370024 [Coniella lustricola]|uniref:RBR-type E3 ubiquitin transferase n=1 Tax=Coniella lustricola TaxID=2025994 RepID=A0A2T3A5Q5_9PEZI|nr:hypothetical protein BD289DRAFT_370024 [Coniella lustricola]